MNKLDGPHSIIRRAASPTTVLHKHRAAQSTHVVSNASSLPTTRPDHLATSACILSAVGTPLDQNGNLHEEGLDRHLEDQWSQGINGVLVAGTLGLMQLQRDDTYRNLVCRALEASAGRGEVFIGAGDTSYWRTCERIDYLNGFRIDGVVVLSPYFVPFSQDELFDYYWALADYSRNPLYLYEIPARTGVKLEYETLERLADHPNIQGIKCSCELEWTREAIRRVGDRLRIAVVALDQFHSLLLDGLMCHVDGIFALAPAWTQTLVRAAAAGDAALAEEYQRRLVRLLTLMRQFGSFQTFTTLLNARGIPGNYAPLPFRPLTEKSRQQLLDSPVVQLAPH
jgi:4-hydroxy-tetrahydrodipicolinate synthase